MSKTAVVFIHGLGSNENETWKDLRAIINDSSNFTRNFNYFAYEYESQKIDSLRFNLTHTVIKKIANLSDSDNSTDFSQIKKLSKAFKTYLDSDIFSGYDNIFIVAHSMGGLISTRLLLDEIANAGTLKVKKLLCICTPFLGSDFASAVKNIGIGSTETGEMKVKSKFLTQLLTDVKATDFENKVDCSYFFGASDKVITDYSKESSKTFKGDHSSILDQPGVQKVYDEMIKFFLEKKHNTFFEHLYTKAVSARDIFYKNDIARILDNNEINYDKLQKNKLDLALLNKDERKLFDTFLKLVNNPSFNPHEEYIGGTYNVDIEENKILLDEYWEEISQNKRVLPYFYIGPRGCGKTFLQNNWLDNKKEDMEQQNVFHVRCDVHKIYDAIRSSKDNGSIKISDYLDMQFLYIFLKYRDEKYNNKGKNTGGCSSPMLQRIDVLLDKKDTTLFKNSKFTNLGDFLDKQSKHIEHNEVKIRSGDRTYSFAMDLMKNSVQNVEIDFISVLLRDYDKLVRAVKENEANRELDMFLGVLGDTEREKALEEIVLRIDENGRGDDDELKNAAMQYTLTKIKSGIKKKKRNTTILWKEVSKYIQKEIISSGYKILKIIDGIDNIFIQDHEQEKVFFEDKIKEVNSIIEGNQLDNIYYFISLRRDTFIQIEQNKPNEKGFRTGDISGGGRMRYTLNSHSSMNEALETILKKRYNAAIENIGVEHTLSDTLYFLILKYTFNIYPKKSNHNEWEIRNFRIILRHYLFLSLQVLFELKKNNHVETKFSETQCCSLIEEHFYSVFFLKNLSHVNTERRTVNDQVEGEYKAFPNVFYIDQGSVCRHEFWLGLCQIRILQLLGGSELEVGKLVEILENIYPKDYILKQVDIAFHFNLIETDFGHDTKKIKYKTTDKGRYLLSIIGKDMHVLYYLCLDTALPKELIIKPLIEIHNEVIKYNKLRGYANSVIKTVTTFILFIKYIHEEEILVLRQKGIDEDIIDSLRLPVDCKKIELAIKSVYLDTVKNYEPLQTFFKKVGKYEATEELKRDLESFKWKMTKEKS